MEVVIDLLLMLGRSYKSILTRAGFFSVLCSFFPGASAADTIDYETACTSLGNSDSSTFSALNTTIFNATFYSDAAPNVPVLGTCQSSANISVPLCRVQFYVNTSDISALTAEMWLPTNYSGRLLGLGNGGLGGCKQLGFGISKFETC